MRDLIAAASPEPVRVKKGLVRLAGPQGRGSLHCMTSPSPYRGFRYPAEVIQHAVWLYHCFSLSLRDVELILAARGVAVSYETVREWGLRFGWLFGNELKRRRPRPGDRWFMDEVFIRHNQVADLGASKLADRASGRATIRPWWQPR
ncbi:hypothetical protein ACFQX4_26270 [Roseomonas sp. GCM10028921]